MSVLQELIHIPEYSMNTETFSTVTELWIEIQGGMKRHKTQT